MITLLTVLHILVCIFLILVVLLQQGKGADWAGAFGGGGTQTAFGARGAGTILSKATTVAAVLFMVLSLALAILISQRGGGTSVIRESVIPPAPTQPAQPGQQPPAPPQQQQPATPAQPPGTQPGQ